MYVCIYTYIYTFTYINIHIYTYINTYIYIHVVHIYIYICIHSTHAYIYIFVHIHMTCIHFLQCFYQRIRALRRRDLFQHRFPQALNERGIVLRGCEFRKKYMTEAAADPGVQGANSGAN